MQDVALRPAISAAIVMGSPWLALSVLFAVAALVGHTSLWLPACICLAVLVLTNIWVFSHRLEVENGFLRYTSLFGPKVTISVAEIAATKHQVGSKKFSDRFLPTVRLKIVPSRESSVSSFVINQKIFKKEEIEQLAEAIGGKERA